VRFLAQVSCFAAFCTSFSTQVGNFTSQAPFLSLLPSKSTMASRSRNRNRGAHKSSGDAVSKSGDQAAPIILNEPMATRSGGARKSKDKAAPILDKPMAPRSGGARKSAGKAAILEPKPAKRKNIKSLATGRPTASFEMLKRKASDSNEIQATSKRSKGEPVQDDKIADEYSTRQDIIKILDPLLNGIASVQRSFAIYAGQASWYAKLGERKDILETLCQTISNRVELINHAQLKDSFTLQREDKPNDEDHAMGRILVDQFRALERLRKEVITESKNFPPSIYCRTPIWQNCQEFPNLAIRAGRSSLPITFPLPLALLHPAFRVFVSSMRYPPSLNFTSDAGTKSLISIVQCVDKLLLSMPEIYWSHDKRLQAFKEALVIAFPENESYEWSTNCTTSLDPSNPTGAREKVDLVYRDRKTLVPFIFVEVKLEPGRGGDPFWQNGRIYQLYAQNNPTAGDNGAPVFFIQLSGTTFIRYGFYIAYVFFSRHPHGNRRCLL
jgi:hypothetical protein